MAFSPEPRKYNQLVSMIKAVFPEFDEKTFFNYGCNGQMNAPEVANPLAHSGFGAPVDELDKIFKVSPGWFREEIPKYTEFWLQRACQKSI